jgi:hypothetical protein
LPVNFIAIRRGDDSGKATRIRFSHDRVVSRMSGPVPGVGPAVLSAGCLGTASSARSADETGQAEREGRGTFTGIGSGG